MLLMLLVLTGYDSLPPLPVLSASGLPEPELWVRQLPNELRIDLFDGHFFGIDADLSVAKFALNGSFTKKNEWTSTDFGHGTTSCSFFLPGIWIEPRLEARLLRRVDEYLQIKPGADLTLFTPSVLAVGSFDWHRWLMNDQISHEVTGEIMLAFDRMRHVPQLTLAGMYLNDDLVPSASLRINVGDFHLKVGSLIRTVPFSPSIAITYAEPWVDITTRIRTGIKHNMTEELFEPELPLKYTSAVEAETLSMAAEVTAAFNLGGQELRFSGSYREWTYRLDIDSSYRLSGTREVHEFNLSLSARNRLSVAALHLDNSLHLLYNTSDSALAFVPGHSVIDTMAIRISIFELAGSMRYVPARSGILEELPGYCRLSAAAGIRIMILKCYVAIDNITDTRIEIYDGYFLTGRQYAVGTELAIVF